MRRKASGVPVGTEYHWYIAAHQNVRKLNANDYTTSMTGLKFKMAHKRGDNNTWSASEGAQRKRLIKFLSEVIASLEKGAGAQRRTAQSGRAENPHRSPGQARGVNARAWLPRRLASSTAETAGRRPRYTLIETNSPLGRVVFPLDVLGPR